LLGLTFVALAAAVAVQVNPGRTVYFCEIEVDNFCPGDQSLCPTDPVLHFGSNAYSLAYFNLVDFGNFYAPSGDVEGRAAIKGNMDATAYSFGYQLKTTGVSANSPSFPYGLVVGGNAKWHGGALLPDGSGFPSLGAKEYIYVGGDFSDADSYLQALRTNVACAGCLDADFNNAQSYYQMLASTFNGLSDNTNFNIESWGTIELSCNSFAASQYVVHMTAAQFSSINFWSVGPSCNPGSALIVNIGGTGQVRFWGSTQTYFANQKTVYSIAGNNDVRVEVGVNGHLLAPSSNYNQPGLGVFIGNVIVGNVQQTLQINLVACATPSSNPPPPPSTGHLCPSWETACAGLDLTLAGSTYSFRDFNVISFHDFTADTGDVEGRLAVQHDASFGLGYSVGYELNTAGNVPDRSLPYSVVVGNNLSWGSGALYPQGNGIPHPGNQENMYVGGAFSSTEADLYDRRTGGPCALPNCMDATFNAAAQCYQGFQATIASHADNVAHTIEFSGLSVTCNSNTDAAYYITLTPAELAQFTYVTVGNCNFQGFWYINIAGTGDVEITGDSWPGIPGGNVYNIIGSGRTINVHDTKVFGSILAPSNTLNQASGVIVGKVVAGDITFSSQINRENGCASSVNVTVPVVVQHPVASLNTVEFTNNFLMNGDVVGDATVVGSEGNVYSLSKPITAYEGQVFYVVVSSDNSRITDPNADSSSASMVSVAIAAILALIALVF